MRRISISTLDSSLTDDHAGARPGFDRADRRLASRQSRPASRHGAEPESARPGFDRADRRLASRQSRPASRHGAEPECARPGSDRADATPVRSTTIPAIRESAPDQVPTAPGTRGPVLTLLLLLLVALVLPFGPAQADTNGALVLEGWSSPQLRFLNHATGEIEDLGVLAPTSARLEWLGEGDMEPVLAVVNGDAFGSGSGGSLWLAPVSDVDAAILNGTAIPWTIHSFDDGLNPWDIALAEADDGEYLVAVSFQQGNAVGIYDFDPVALTLSETMSVPSHGPQEVLRSTRGFGPPEFAVAEADGGAGDSVLFLDPLTGATQRVSVGVNPQELEFKAGYYGPYSDDLFVLCTGNYADVEGSLVKLSRGDSWSMEDSMPVPGAPTALAGLSFLYDDEYIYMEGLIGNEYAPSPPHLLGWHENLDGTTPDAQALVSGWSMSGGLGYDDNGDEAWVYWVGSATQNMVKTLDPETLDHIGMHFALDGPAAAITGWTVGSTSVEEAPQASRPQAITLAPVYPNPFNGSATVQFSLDRPGDVAVQLVDVLGRVAATVHRGGMTPGSHRLTLDGGSLAAGRYFVVAHVGGERFVQPVTYLK